MNCELCIVNCEPIFLSEVVKTNVAIDEKRVVGMGKYAFIGSFYAGSIDLFEKGVAAGEAKELNGMWYTKTEFMAKGTHDNDSMTTEVEFEDLGKDGAAKCKRALEEMSAKYGHIEDLDSKWANFGGGSGSGSATSSSIQVSDAKATEGDFVLLQETMGKFAWQDFRQHFLPLAIAYCHCLLLAPIVIASCYCLLPIPPPIPLSHSGGLRLDDARHIDDQEIGTHPGCTVEEEPERQAALRQGHRIVQRSSGTIRGWGPYTTKP